MMKKNCLFVVFLLGNMTVSYCQSRSFKVISGLSASKRINTFPLFDAEPEPKKELKETPLKPETTLAEAHLKPKKDKTEVAPKKEEGKTKKPETTPAATKPTVLTPVKETKPAPTEEEMRGIRTLYFTKDLKISGRRENAHFYRKIAFDKTSEQPKGTVTDFYVNGDKKKFVGQYKRYENTYEDKNKDFDGRCVFYEENGAYAIKNYRNKILNKELRYTANNTLVAQIDFTTDGKRKKFTTYILDEQGQEIGNEEGALNTQNNRVESRQRMFYPSKQLKSEKDFIDDCPIPKATFYKENGEKYEVYYQDFTCFPDLNGFTNQSNFSSTHDKQGQSFKIRATENRAEGILQLPISKYDFYNNPFEMVAVFDLAGTSPMSDFGLVWEFQDIQNYSYLRINTQTKTYEINSIKGGKPDRYMVGIKPLALEITDSQVRITMQKTEAGAGYSLNNRPLQYLKNNAALDFTKFPVADAEGKMTKWGMGFYFRSSAINQTIILKSLEVRLL